MTLPIFYDDAYLNEYDSVVTATGQNWVELESSIFYPSGGGQPGDTGFLTTPSGDDLSVADTVKGEAKETIRHLLTLEENPLKVGDKVRQKIDWERRHRLMRMHSCLHLLCSLVPKGVTGGSVGVDKARLDFDLGDSKVDKVELTEKLNQLIQKEIEITTDFITDEELDQQPDLVRTMSVQPPRGQGRVRVVSVEGVDYQPCGGTHVQNTREIGQVRVASIKSKGKRNRRINLVFD
ncbi:MAG: alanyl-tRNA editing protein [Proteobacteria bacterium]|nr:alanyl-tRNA editing protein [Pseudomonadota bacterium]